MFYSSKSKSKLGNKEKIIDLHKTNELNKKKIENLKLSAESLKKTLASYEGIALPNKDVIVDLKEKLIFTKSNLQNLKNNIERLNEDIDNGYEKIEALKEKIENFDNLQKEFEHKMDILDSTLKFLSLAKENVSQRFVQPINNAMQKLFDKFNFENKKFIIDANFNIMEDNLTGVREFEYSSQGYKDLLSYCMRFYLIKEIFKKELPFIVLDDTFVNLDDNNFKSANELVQEFAEEIQIIYICANSRSKI